VLLDGRAAIEILDERFDWQPEEEGSETVGGLVSGHLGYVPKPGEAVELRGLRFEVERADERRILSLRVGRGGSGGRSMSETPKSGSVAPSAGRTPEIDADERLWARSSRSSPTSRRPPAIGSSASSRPRKDSW
jgi:hypothetical protein